MMIIFLVRRFYPQVGGVETHIKEISKILIKNNHKVTIIAEKPFSQDLQDNEDYEKMNIIRINVGQDDWFKKFRIWRELFKIRKVIYSADIVHCHDVFFWYLPFRLLYPRKKIYTTFHGYEGKFPISKRAILIRKISEKLSNGNICVGDYISKWYGTKTDFVTYGGASKIQNSEFRIQNYKRKLKILLIGRLDPDIGVDIYLKVLNSLKKSKISFEFGSIGDGMFKNKVSKYGKNYGFVDNVSEFIEKSDIIFASSYLTMLQALMLKKIVIAVYNTPIKEDYLKLSPFSRFVYVCRNEKEASDVINSIHEKPWKSTSMIENGYKWASEQTWEKVVGIYLKLWKI